MKLFKFGMAMAALAALVYVFVPNTSNSSQVASTLPPDLSIILTSTK